MYVKQRASVYPMGQTSSEVGGGGGERWHFVDGMGYLRVYMSSNVLEWCIESLGDGSLTEESVPVYICTCMHMLPHATYVPILENVFQMWEFWITGELCLVDNRLQRPLTSVCMLLEYWREAIATREESSRL